MSTYAESQEILNCTTVFEDKISLIQKGEKFRILNRSSDGYTYSYKNLRELSSQEVNEKYPGIERVFSTKDERVILGYISESLDENAFSSVFVSDGVMLAAKCKSI